MRRWSGKESRGIQRGDVGGGGIRFRFFFLPCACCVLVLSGIKSWTKLGGNAFCILFFRFDVVFVFRWDWGSVRLVFVFFSASFSYPLTFLSATALI